MIRDIEASQRRLTGLAATDRDPPAALHAVLTVLRVLGGGALMALWLWAMCWLVELL